MKAFSAVTLVLAVSCSGSPPHMPAPASLGPAEAEAVGELEPPRLLFPPTPAGKTLGAWFDAFNSGDEARIKEFASMYMYSAPEDLATLRNQTGGFDIVSVETSWRLALRFVVKEKSGPTSAVGGLRVKDTDPALI